MLAKYGQEFNLPSDQLSMCSVADLDAMRLLGQALVNKSNMEKLYRVFSARAKKNLESLEKYIGDCANLECSDVVNDRLITLAKAIIVSVINDEKRTVNVLGNFHGFLNYASDDNDYNNDGRSIRGYYSMSVFIRNWFLSETYNNYNNRLPNQILLIIFSYSNPIPLTNSKRCIIRGGQYYPVLWPLNHLATFTYDKKYDSLNFCFSGEGQKELECVIRSGGLVFYEMDGAASLRSENLVTFCEYLGINKFYYENEGKESRERVGRSRERVGRSRSRSRERNSSSKIKRRRKSPEGSMIAHCSRPYLKKGAGQGGWYFTDYSSSVRDEGYSTEMLALICYILMIPFTDKNFFEWNFL